MQLAFCNLHGSQAILKEERLSNSRKISCQLPYGNVTESGKMFLWCSRTTVLHTLPCAKIPCTNIIFRLSVTQFTLVGAFLQMCTHAASSSFIFYFVLRCVPFLFPPFAVVNLFNNVSLYSSKSTQRQKCIIYLLSFSCIFIFAVPCSR